MKRTILLSITIVMSITNLICGELIQWSVSEGGSGHLYEVVSFPVDVTAEEIAVAIAGMGEPYAVIGEDGIGWHEARIIADYRGGYLAAIESQAENDFIFSLIDNPTYWDGGAGPWFGGAQDLASPDYTEPDGAWVWIYDYQNVNFQPMIYTNWYRGEEPNNSGGYENVTHFCTEGASLVPSPYWNDRPSNIPCNSFVVEYVPEPCTLLFLGLGGMILTRNKNK